LAGIEQDTNGQATVMDVTEEQVARVYARAFMNVVIRRDDADSLVEEIESLADDVLAKVPAFEKTLRSSLVPQEQKEALLDRVFAPRASQTLLNFLKVLARHNRLELLRPIARLLKQMHAEHRGLLEVLIRVASPLDPQLKSELEGRLRTRFGKEPVLRVTVEPSLIAGIIMRIGDQVFDGSLANQFELARRAMIARAVEHIETKPEKFVSA
jgi:F-type H+-transporting ATPase subunit delta